MHTSRLRRRREERGGKEKEERGKDLEVLLPLRKYEKRGRGAQINLYLDVSRAFLYILLLSEKKKGGKEKKKEEKRGTLLWPRPIL